MAIRVWCLRMWRASLAAVYFAFNWLIYKLDYARSFRCAWCLVVLRAGMQNICTNGSMAQIRLRFCKNASSWISGVNLATCQHLLVGLAVTDGLPYEQ